MHISTENCIDPSISINSGKSVGTTTDTYCDVSTGEDNWYGEGESSVVSTTCKACSARAAAKRWVYPPRIVQRRADADVTVSEFISLSVHPGPFDESHMKIKKWGRGESRECMQHRVCGCANDTMPALTYVVFPVPSCNRNHRWLLCLVDTKDVHATGWVN